MQVNRLLTTFAALFALQNLGLVSAQSPYNSAQQGNQAISSSIGKDTLSIGKDTLFSKPYIDRQEWRDKPVRHYYVHGGFRGTDTRFSFYFPPKNQYQGRFFNTSPPFLITKTSRREPPARATKLGSQLLAGPILLKPMVGEKPLYPA